MGDMTPVPEVGAVFDRFAPDLRAALLSVRRLILRIAAEDPRIGPLDESLKWGQPAYRPRRARTGTTVRLGALRDEPDHYGVFFHCQSGLIARFRDLYADRLGFQADRAIVLSIIGERDDAALGHCLTLALTHHLKRTVCTKASQSR